MKKVYHLQSRTNEKRQHFAIRRWKIGVASIAIFASVFLAGNVLAQADETHSVENSSLSSTLASVANSSHIASTREDASDKLNLTPVRFVQENSPSSTTNAATTSPSAKKETTEKKEDAVANSAEKATPVVETKSEDKIAEGNIRLHFKTLPSDNLASLGLWTWDDVETPSSQKGSWPTGATSFSTAKKDDYGYYLDVKMAEKRSKISLLINNTAGTNLTGDKTIELLSPNMNEVWFDKDYNPHPYEPLKEGLVRINYYRTDGKYDKKSLWLWGDVENPSKNWPDGVDFVKTGKYGRYVDVPLKDAAKTIGFLLLDENKSGDDVKIQPQDYNLTNLKKNSQIFLRDADPNIYTNPYFVNDIRMTGAQHIGLTEIEATFSTLENAKKEDILKNLKITDKNKKEVAIKDVILDVKNKKAKIVGDFGQAQAPYTIKYGNDQFTTSMNWQLKDSIYKYDGELGARVSQAGKQVDVTFWSPSADQVDLVIYDKNDQNKIVGKVVMTKGEAGTWKGTLTSQTNLGIKDYRGYFYHYEITRGGKKVLALDPYAKSLAAWNSEDAEKGESYKIAKAAFVEPSEYGPKDLTYAKIPNFKKREDALIYETHVRDFTSDPAISKDLKSQFGTFSAFIEKLDYLKDLGVTHIQLLPVLSYYFVNELKNAERMDKYASSNSNYNWGYDPQNYFSLTGMYSTNPKDPAKRIEEFKNLVNEIHKRGMGVIMDVVYNHTAKTSIFEDLEPNYYHFMDADGTPRTSFGGGRLGTTHYMSRRVLVDSIKYLTSEYKVDGFRFDMMGDHDAESIQKAYEEAKKLNPNLVMLGEGWKTYTGDENKPVQPADQSWMKSTDTVGVFSDDIRNTLKSGYPNEGAPAFITGGKRNVESVFKNIKAQPTNFEADSPGDAIQYIAAHDNLTLFDIIAQSIKKDPAVPANNQEIHRRLRLGNLMVLTSQGTPFIHSGQEYGRTKQFRDPAYKYPVPDDKVPNKSHLLTNADGTPFEYPYFIHDSYDSSDAVNHFDWTKATDSGKYPENAKSRAYMKGLIALRKSTDAFTRKTKAEVDQNVTLITQPGKDGVGKEDLILGYQVVASNGDIYAVLINADSKERKFNFGEGYKHLAQAEIVADANTAGVAAISNPAGVNLGADGVSLAPLTATILRIQKKSKPNQEKPNGEDKHQSGLSRPKEDSGQAAPSSTQRDTSTEKIQQQQIARTKSDKFLPSTGTTVSMIGILTGIVLLLSGVCILKKKK
ncbi:pullulanase [Streptococcus constellatus subsp. pharyngis]|uniref:pullulanase n=1 Tax=Streptococcus constellatus subsp. pharyngis SK1060 = CCUG 46377 TaxID=1035184 RepID=U2YBI7_STRCV|nr:pullulanase [Streptococcus constellatus]AGU73420.1 putative alkaline amylopullulanase [Streptococcus constellatus subsp. pharyngis C232]AGU75174.1 putative alkaline amylopullulanase [Streptococcus constellatus subsp. pharyngis C818]AGU80565.1 putative alkaline amylopullulanase [Streptococcus constellatus subsp. pharyngis C1050]QRP81085.1 pullulanase [Streptococcus constellatus]GAD44495.1 type II secretory pathway, pullulanase PulA [Streptococcus constellatus subsp. pharyngis SK1060 = CCUG 4